MSPAVSWDHPSSMFLQSTCTEINQLLEYLYGLQRLGIKVGLEHSKRLIKACGNPHREFSSIHIAGTNGKGSTGAMIASILREAGYKTGLYTSPHLVRFNERIRINGTPIPDKELARFISLFRPEIEKIESTFFETASTIAFWYFAREKVDVAVVETGMGGRLDSTNVLDSEMSVITAISHDHGEYLGTTLEEIAGEKGGIIKPGKPVIIAPQDQKVSSVLSNISNNLKSKSISVDLSKLTYCNTDLEGSRFFWRQIEFELPLVGRHQLENALTALEAVACYNPGIQPEKMIRGLKNITWPGRLQALSRNPWIFYDVAHNVQGVSVVLDALSNFFPKTPVGIVALKEDKDLHRLAPVLRNGFHELAVTSISESRLWDAEDLFSSLKSMDVKVKLITPIQDALTWLEGQGSEKRPVLIFGSHYIAESVYDKFDFPFVNESI